MYITLKEIIEATGGRLINGKSNGLNGNSNGLKGISIDTRSMRDGELYVALKGSRFDGHDFLREALNMGSGAIVSLPPVAPPMGKVIVHVGNTLAALQDIARFIRRKSGIPVVGITGTNGKTTTKEMAAAVLGGKYRVLKNTGNLNNQVGLPLSLLSLTGEDEVAVLEMGAAAPGDIRELCGVALPEYGVLTNVGPAHIDGFRDVETVRSTKLELLDTVRTLVVNADDAFLMAGVEGFYYDGRIIRYGMEASYDVYAAGVAFGERDCTFTLHMGGRGVRVRLGVTGRVNVSNALAAAAVGMALGVGPEDVARGLEAFEGVPMRLQIKDLKGATVISDVYNANPASMEEALKEMVRLRKRRAVAVLGDMLQLGPYAESAHRTLGRWMGRSPVDLFIAVGPNMALAAEEFSACGGEAIKAEDALEARSILLQRFREGDTILIKGSRDMRMERVIEDVV
jgi:UDP-N-acetylmuramoyl-tripeptide--D-alanyl-D-alanine ligase